MERGIPMPVAPRAVCGAPGCLIRITLRVTVGGEGGGCVAHAEEAHLPKYVSAGVRASALVKSPARISAVSAGP
jgi:hypothetical protein